jgi:ABC-type lipopolysaccharide export system ATPase subunit
MNLIPYICTQSKNKQIMEKFIKRLMKRIYVKWLLWNRNSSTKEQKISQTQKMCLSIARSLITHPESKFLMAPLSGKRYIKNAQLDLFCILDHGTISITNHVYHYSVKLSERNQERITYIFDTETEKRRLSYEDLINSQIKNSLHNVLERITNL